MCLCVPTVVAVVVVLLLLICLSHAQAHPPYLEDYEVRVINNCRSECTKTDGTACTVYDYEYLACDTVLTNVRVWVRVCVPAWRFIGCSVCCCCWIVSLLLWSVLLVVCAVLPSSRAAGTGERSTK